MHPLQNYQNYNPLQLIHEQNEYMRKLNNILDNHNNVNKMYQNVNYKFNYDDRKTLIIDHVLGATDKTFTINLVEPLIIDETSEIYLEHFTTFDALHNYSNADGNATAFLFSVDEFPIKNFSNESSLLNALIIPNEETNTGGDKMRIHKGKKMNYICTINPTKITRITGKITALDGTSTMFSSAKGRFIAELVIIAKKK